MPGGRANVPRSSSPEARVCGNTSGNRQAAPRCRPCPGRLVWVRDGASLALSPRLMGAGASHYGLIRARKNFLSVLAVTRLVTTEAPLSARVFVANLVHVIKS